jgi:hypothetical protein
MRLINNVNKHIYYYISENQSYGFLNFGQQLETNKVVISFLSVEEWKNHINTSLGTDTWLNENLKKELEEQTKDTAKHSDVGYLTPYNFRLPVNNETDSQLNQLLSSNTDPVRITAMSGDIYTLSRDDLVSLIDQYTKDKPLYLAVLEGK